MTAPSVSQIRAQVRAVLDKWPERRRIGIRSAARWPGPPSLELDDSETLHVVPCRSSLELRQRLLEAEGSDDVWVFLADLAPTELEADLRGRLAKGRLLEPERWQTVCGFFGARQVDPRLVRHAWIADVLTDAAPPAGYRPVASGVLDEATARRAVLETHLGLGEAEASPAPLLRWASAPDTQERYASAPEELRRELADWLAPAGGPLAEVLAALLAAGHGVDAVPLGLAADVMWSAAAAPASESAVLLLSERYLDRWRPTPEAARAWAEAALEAVRRRVDDQGVDAAEPWLRRAEEVLEELGAISHAIAGDWLPRAFEERLARAVERLERWLRERKGGLAAAEQAAAELAAHGLAARRHGPRLRTLERALALARWLERPPAPAPDLAAAVLGYADDGSWVDLARLEVGRGDPSEAAARVYERLAEATREERERQNRRFAELLRAAGAAPPEHPRVAGVEQVLARWAAPLAGETPLLVLVLDGLGQVAWRELRGDRLLRDTWNEIVPEPADGRGVALAVLPSETRTSRVSLCCGRVAEGTRADERRGFEAHPSFASSRRPPRLFVPGELKAPGGGVAEEARDEILGQRPVVGVVLSEIDAYFESMSDLRAPFGVASVGPLRDLLQLAAEAGRAVLVTGDHGQVPGGGTELRRPEGDYSGRHRSGDEEAGEGELKIAGRRVLAEGNELVVPWSERPRYRKGGRAGYHGGVTPQEMLVPVAVLARRGVEIAGWQPLDELPPAWWQAPAAAPAPAAPAKAAARVRGEPAQLSLLEPPAAGGWLDRLLASEVYVQQQSLAGRRPPPESQVRRLLAALASAGGAATLPALARELGTPRLRGLLTQASRLLNVDGFGVLTVDETSETVRLDRPLLEKQFGLTEPGR